MTTAWIDGEAASPEAAVAAAADLLTGCRMPLVTGLEADVDGVRAAFVLARSCGGVVDHGASSEIYALISVLRDNGMIVASPSEVRRRTDMVLILGEDPFAAAPDMPRYLFAGSPDLGSHAGGARRRAIWLGAPSGEAQLGNTVEVEPVSCADADLADTLGTLRAAMADRPFAEGALDRDRIAELVATLKEARFGTVVFSPASMDPLCVEAIAGLVEDLNDERRFAALPVLGGSQAWGAAQAATATSGFPLRTAFGRGYGEHDPELYRADRLMTGGEADLAVVVDAMGGSPLSEPSWSDRAPTITITAQPVSWKHRPKIEILVDAAEASGSGIFWDERFGSFVPKGEAGGRRPDALATAAETLDAISARLGEASLGNAA